MLVIIAASIRLAEAVEDSSSRVCLPFLIIYCFANLMLHHVDVVRHPARHVCLNTNSQEVCYSLIRRSIHHYFPTRSAALKELFLYLIMQCRCALFDTETEKTLAKAMASQRVLEHHRLAEWCARVSSISDGQQFPSTPTLTLR